MFRRSRFSSWVSFLLPSFMAALGLAASGCTYTTDGTAPGTLAIQPPGSLPNLPPAAPGADGAEPALPPSGAYEGVARLATNLAGGCTMQVRVRHFIVADDRVRYLAFRGTIRPDLHVRMQAGRSFIYGDFDGGRFVGRFWRPQPSCTYNVVLNHVG